MSWKPASTAPRDGTRIIIFYGAPVVAGWEYIRVTNKMGWVIVNSEWVADDMVTHWMPVPRGPEPEEKVYPTLIKRKSDGEMFVHVEDGSYATVWGLANNSVQRYPFRAFSSTHFTFHNV